MLMSQNLKMLVMLMLLSIVLERPVFAHPGKTAVDGCHYCRTNCDKWGVPWNERHCHGGGTAAAAQVIYTAPTNTTYPHPTWTPRPTTVPTLKSTSTPLSTSTPTSTVSPTSSATVTLINTPSQTPTSVPAPKPTATVLGTTKSSDGAGLGGAVVFLTGFGVIIWRAINQKWPFHSKV